MLRFITNTFNNITGNNIIGLTRYLSTNTASVSKIGSTELLIAVSDLSSKYGKTLDNLPTPVVIGPQSAGKSSVVESIIGFDILPKDMGMCTLKPINITTIRSTETKFKVGDKEFTDLAQAKKELHRLNYNSNVSSVNVRIHSPGLTNMFITDLPGIFVVTEGINDEKLPKKVKHMTIEHIEKSNCYPIIVQAGPTDPATNPALQYVSKFKRREDSMGVITKMDLTVGQHTQQIEDMLKGNRYKLGNGWVAVLLRSNKDIDNGISISEKMEEEKRFFKDKPNFNPSGVETLRKKIGDLQFEKIKYQIPFLIEEVDKMIIDLHNSASFLTNLINDPNKSLAIKLESLIRKLVGSSMERAEFEEALKRTFKKTVNEYMEETFKDDNSIDTFVLSNNIIDGNIFKYHSNHRTNPDQLKFDDFEELFSYGLVSPVLVNGNTLVNAFNKECTLACSLPVFDMVVRDEQGKKRMKWNNYLRRYFASLLSNENIQNIVYKITVDMLLEYINNDPEGSTDDLSRKFSEYIVNVIGSEAYNSHIKYSIEAMINTEKRPHISAMELCRHFVQMYPEHFRFHGGFYDTFNKNNKRVEIEIYSEAWNKAYLKAVSDNLAENIYRNVAVNLLDKMVQKLLEMTIDMFNKDNAVEEQNKVTNKIQDLQNIKAIFKKFSEQEENKSSRVCDNYMD